MMGKQAFRTLGIVGSSINKDGPTGKLVASAIAGAQAVGSQTDLIYLMDYEIPQFADHWTGCRKIPEELVMAVNSADAYVLGAPVYFFDVNGLTKDFMDDMESSMSDSNGKPALGISMAGGTGKGLASALKSVYAFFFCMGLRGVDPLPVSRFNFEKAMQEAYDIGKRLVALSKARRPFGTLREHIEYHFGLRFMNYDMVDEIMLLAEQLIEITDEKSLKAKTARTEFEKARKLIAQGRKAESIEHAVAAYEILYY